MVQAEIDVLVANATKACLARDFASAEPMLRAALDRDPRRYDAAVNLAIALNEQRRWAETRVLCDSFVGDPEAPAQLLTNLGNALAGEGAIERALDAFVAALSREPAQADAGTNIGLVLLSAGARLDAVATLERLIAAFPANLELRREYGAALARRRRLAEAERVFRDVLARDPHHTRAGYELGGALCDLNRWADAEATFSTCIRLEPQRAELYQARGVTRSHLNRFAESIFDQEAALRLNPDYAQAWLSLGAALMHAGRIDDACEAYRRSLSIQPDKHDVHGNLCFALSYLPGATQAEIRREHIAWGERHAPSVLTRPLGREPDGILRIGFVSPDLRTHSVAYFLLPLLDGLDRAKIRIHCYADNVYEDRVTERLRRASDGWRDIWGIDDDTAAAAIAADRLDVLIDLAGHTSKNRLRLFARRPAPVQMTWLGYPETTGMADIDFKIADAIVAPEALGDIWRERPLRLPLGFHCFEASAEAPAVSSPPCMRNGYITFGSFNNLAKINPGVVALWGSVLAAVPGSRLILKNRQLADPAIRDKYRAMFAVAGLGAARVILDSAQDDMAAHLGRYADIDVALDPFPYSGTTTTAEALWQGVPVVTLIGETAASRVSASLLSQIGLEALIADDADRYVAIAITLAADIHHLCALRENMRKRMRNSPLGDAKIFAAQWLACVRQAHDDLSVENSINIPDRGI